MFKHLDNEINLVCPRCKGSNIYIGETMKVNPKETVRCNDCHYSQLSYRFKNQDKVDNYSSSKEIR